MIDGLTYLPEYLSTEEHDALWTAVNAESWLDVLKRRVQHYGYRYDYKARRIDASMRVGEFPEWAENLACRLQHEGLFAEKPDQLIVNEYEAGQGIALHVDCEPCFSDTIVSISLGSTCVMDFAHRKTKEKKSLLLDVGSLVVLQEAARYDWQHGIAGRKTDVFFEEVYPRSRRVSLTFRKVLLS